MRRAAFVLFAGAALLAGVVPLLVPAANTKRDSNAAFPGWPSHHDGRRLTEMPLTSKDALFTRDFPGRVGRFSDGQREIVIRWVMEPTRKLHPAADCFRGAGYAIKPLPMRSGASGHATACFGAASGSDHLTVCEHIRDDRGRSWPDVSSWYWSALWEGQHAGWWSFVVAERSGS